MTPDEVAAHSSLLLRFQNEVAYVDRMEPSEGEVRDDIELLHSKDGVLVIAWLWPSPIYESSFDPFNAAPRANRTPLEDGAGPSQQVDAAKSFKTASRAFDRERQGRRQVPADRFARIIESTARAADCSVEHLKTHLMWSTPLNQIELDRLLDGYAPFPFPVIVGLCRALQLEFTDAWVLVDPQHLARHVGQSVLASEISNLLHYLTLDNLESVVRKLPRGSVNAGPAQDLGIFRAPQPGGRYWSLYEALAADVRDHPDYMLAEIDRVLVDAGEMRLPVSASSDRSWWAGGGAKPEGRPQVSAWWAAGYRIRNITIDPSSGQATSIGFEALPGRAKWRANPERTVQREFRGPGPEKVSVYPDIEGIKAGLTGMVGALSVQASEVDIEGIKTGLTGMVGAFRAQAVYPDVEGIKAGLIGMVGAFRAQASEVDIEGISAGLTGMPAALERIKELNRSRVDARAKLEANVPDDPDIRHLTELLDRHGEADRSQIERHFKQVREEPFDAAWMTNLLTKARRQGWTVNNGTRSRPRWSATRPTAELIADIADTLDLETPVLDPGDAVPVDFLRLVANSVGADSVSFSAPQIARGIIESLGGTWRPGFESADKSLTGLGLMAVRDALRLRADA